MLLSTAAPAQAQKPTTGYAPVDGLQMYYEIHGSGVPVVLLHGGGEHFYKACCRYVRKNCRKDDAGFYHGAANDRAVMNGAMKLDV
jgi:pimeloyl-ACP methyl ester carboxylesterase